MFHRTIARHRVGRGEITVIHELPELTYEKLSMRNVRTSIRFAMTDPDTDQPMVLELAADGESWFSVAAPVSLLIRVAINKSKKWPRSHWFRQEVEHEFLQWLSSNRQYLVRLATHPPRIIEERAKRCTPIPTPPPTADTPSSLESTTSGDTPPLPPSPSTDASSSSAAAV